MITFIIDLSPDKEKKLEMRAQDRGLDIPSYVNTLIDRDILARPTIDEILKPIRREFASRNMSEEDLDMLIDEVRDEVWRDKNKQQ